MTEHQDPKIKLPLAAWDAGYAAGLRGADPLRCPYERGTPEGLAWFSAFIEGKARRLRGGAT